MKMVPISEITDELWYEIYLTVYSKEMAYHMGIDPRLIVNPPPLVQFYESVMAQVEKGLGYGWAMVKDGKYIGHVIMDKRSGEWEIATAIPDASNRRGYGVKATYHAMKWVFDEQGDGWIIAYTQGKDPKVKEMLSKVGFKPFMNFMVFDRRTWEERGPQWRKLDVSTA